MPNDTKTCTIPVEMPVIYVRMLSKVAAARGCTVAAMISAMVADELPGLSKWMSAHGMIWEGNYAPVAEERGRASAE